MRLHSVALAVLLAIGSAARADPVTERVVAVADGDTLTVLAADGARIVVRLAEIDSPERGQPWADRARDALRALVARKYVRLEPKDVDRYGRTVARVYVGPVDVNAELVRVGAAWVYRRFATDERLFALEREARAGRRGLWALPESERIPPWTWRSEHRASEGRCGAKTSCREMKSCEEARFYLEHCGATQLDRDRDGVPCNSLCRE